MSSVIFNNPTWRLGNQMFQYAALLGISDKTGAKPVFNIDNTYLGSCFELGSVENGVGSNYNALFNEPSFSFDEIAFSIPNDMNIVINGYFQSEKYFKHCENKLRDDFFFKENVRNVAAESLSEGVLVSIHVRRGDYKNLKQHHPMPTVEWYEEAYKRFEDHTPVVFSDDIEWCKNNLSHLSDDIYFSDSKSTDGSIDTYVDLCMMSMCNSHIIANSTFSWWGAWLGKGPTVAPKQWFGPLGEKHWDDLYCDGWQVL